MEQWSSSWNSLFALLALGRGCAWDHGHCGWWRSLKEFPGILPKLRNSPGPRKRDEQPSQGDHYRGRFFVLVFHNVLAFSDYLVATAAPGTAAKFLSVSSLVYQCLGFTGRTKELAMNPTINRPTMTYRTVE